MSHVPVNLQLRDVSRMNPTTGTIVFADMWPLLHDVT